MIRVAVITISDSAFKGERVDENKAIIEEGIKKINGKITHYEIIPDDFETIKEKLVYCADELGVEIVFTNGGTGFSKRDVTPEATREVIEKFVPGIPEAMRFEGFKKTKRAMLSRAIAGIRGETLIINLPGSSRGVKESLEAIVDELPHGLEMIRGKGHSQ